jgi:hypothetical protein
MYLSFVNPTVVWLGRATVDGGGMESRQSGPPPVPVYVNAKQAKLLQQTQTQTIAAPVPWLQPRISPDAAGFVAPPPAAALLSVPDVPQQLDDVEAEDEVPIPMAFGRTQFVQVFHNTPLVKPKGDAGRGTRRRSRSPRRHGNQAQVDKDRDGNDGGLAALSAVVKEPRMPLLNFEIPFESIRMGELIGQGAFGRVHKGYVVCSLLLCLLLTCSSQFVGYPVRSWRGVGIRSLPSLLSLPTAGTMRV